MRILLADDDLQLGGVLRTVLGSHGHDVLQVEGARRAVARLRAQPFDLLVIDVDLSDGGPSAVVASMDEDDRQIPVILTGDHPADAPRVQRLMPRARQFLRKPISVLDLTDALRRQVPGSGTEAIEAPSHPVRLTQAVSLARLWLTRATGTVSCQLDAASVPVRLRLSAGAPIGTSALDTVQRILGAERLQFQPGPVSGDGEWGRMGAALVDAVRDSGQRTFAATRAESCPGRVSWASAFASAGVPPELVRLLSAADGLRTLGELMIDADADPADISADLEALYRLQLVDLHSAPRKAPRQQVTAAERIAAGRRPTYRPPPRGDGLPRPRDPKVARRRKPVRRTPRTPGERKPGALEVRLSKELSRLRGASPAVVLAIPSNASASLIEQAAHRLRKRYSDIVEERRTPEPARELAAALLVQVETAHRMLSDRRSRVRRSVIEDAGFDMPSAPSRAASAPAQQEEVLLQMGRDLMRQGAWAQADKVLSKAKNIRLDHAIVLANLGWARLHNRTMPEDRRDEEAREFLLLAEQFGPEERDVLFYLSSYMLRIGRLKAAQRRAARLLRESPGDPDAKALLAQIRSEMAQKRDE